MSADHTRSGPAIAPLLALDAVATRLDVSIKTVRRIIDRGELPVHRVGRLLRISEADLAEYVVARRHVSRSH